MRDAMRDGDALRRDTLRMVLSAAHNAQVAARRPLTDDELLAVLAKEAKTRRESIEAFTSAGRVDLADKERAEADIIAAYLPAALTEDELRVMVGEAIAATGATSARDLGKVMGTLSPRSGVARTAGSSRASSHRSSRGSTWRRMAMGVVGAGSPRPRHAGTSLEPPRRLHPTGRRPLPGRDRAAHGRAHGGARPVPHLDG
ncbi:MAG: GatB/YqeY domain-containing protein [Chloroflexota bacterium]